MSLEAKIGQMVMIGFDGQAVDESPGLSTMIKTYQVGGVVLLEANAHDPEQIRALTEDLQGLAASSGASIPLLIAINHEGGIVVRITEGVTGFPGNMAVAAAQRPDYAYMSAALAAQELRAMGLNMNLAPVLDVNDEPLNPVIGVRSFGENPAIVAEYGRLAIRGSQQHGVIAAAKHFPGHGGVAVDSHGTLPVINHPRAYLESHDLLPFAAAIDEGVAAIMTAHIAVPALDASGLPATLSAPIMTRLLREEMGYQGLIVTDSLGMAGVSAGRGQDQAAVASVEAGVDVVLSTAPQEAHIAIVQALNQAVQNGRISEARINESVRRILHVKQTYGLLESPVVGTLADVGRADTQQIADEMALAATTVIQDTGGGLPLPAPPASLLVISPNHLPPSSDGQGTLFGERLRRRDYQVEEWVLDLNSAESRASVLTRITTEAAAYDHVIVGEWELIKRAINWGDTWQETLISTLQGQGISTLVVAWHNPAAALRCPPGVPVVTAYGNTPAQVNAVVEVLTGDQPARGVMPMHLD
jgi:beta-N-acetylhexosaminidase